MKKRARFYDVISIGEAGIDTFLKIHDASLVCSVNKDNCLLCFNYADKIPVEALHESLGHNACNLAVGSARLGLKSALYATIGGDGLGEKIQKKLKQERVSTEYIHVQKNSVSSSSVVLNYQTERTILIYHAQRKFVLPKLAPATWLYLTSLGKGFGKIHQELLKQMKTNGWKLAFNPGDQQLRSGTKKLRPILRACDLLVVNKEEAGILLDEPMKDMKEGLKGLRSLGPETVVVTDGSRGLYGFNGTDAYFLKPLPAKVLEGTGAGDSCSTGILAALASGKKLGDAMLWGAANAASVIEHIGPQKGLLTRPQILARIKKSKAVIHQL